MLGSKGLRKCPGCWSCVAQNLGRAHVKNLLSVLTQWIRQTCKYFLVQSTHVIMHFVTLFLGFDERRVFVTLIMDVPFSQSYSVSILCL